MDIVQSIVALILIVVFGVIYLMRRRHTEGLTGPLEAEIQRYVDDEFTKYYRPTEAGYLYLLTVVSKDADFIQLSQAISPAARCVPPQPSGKFVPGTISLGSNRGWFYEQGPAYIMTPPQFEIPPLDSDEVSPQNKCSPDPNLLKFLAEQIILINTGYKTIPFFINTSKYGATANISALPLKGIETYVFTLNIMVGIGQSMIDKLKNMGKTIDVAAIKSAAKKAASDAIESFTDDCCKPATPADLAALKARADTLVAGDSLFNEAMARWMPIEKELRSLYEKLGKGFTPENLVEFGFNEADFSLE